jgi:hypothetical protein
MLMLLLLMLLTTPFLAESAGGQTSDRDMDSIESKNSIDIKENEDMSSKKERLIAVEKFIGKNLGAENMGLCTIVSIGY